MGQVSKGPRLWSTLRFAVHSISYFKGKSLGVFICSILASIVTILVKYCDNTYKYWANTWKMCSPATVILASIVTILVSLEGILKGISVIINFKSQF